MIDTEQDQDAQRLFEHNLLVCLITATVAWNGALLVGALQVALWLAERA